MTISFFVLSEILTMTLCKMSQDTGGSYQQTFCRNLSGLIIVIYIMWPFHFIGFVCCMIQTCMEGNRGSQLLNTWVTSTYGWVLRVFSVPLRTEWWPSGDRGRTTRHVPLPPSYCNTTQQYRSFYLFGFSEGSVSALAPVRSPCWHFMLFR